MLSLPDDWNYSIEGLVAICKENETAIKSTLKELKEFGYLTIAKMQNEKGIYEYAYNIFENPQVENPPVDNPPMENPEVEVPTMENQGQLNTKESSTKKTKTKESRTKYIAFFPLDEKLNQAFKDYVEYRKKSRKPMTEKAIDLAIKKLDSMTNDNDEKINIINQSILNGWTGLFPLKNANKSSGSAYIDAINNRLDCVDEWARKMKEAERNEY